MKPSNGTGSDPDSYSFEAALAGIVYEAALEGVDVEGGWDISSEIREDLPDFGVEIYEVES